MWVLLLLLLESLRACDCGLIQQACCWWSCCRVGAVVENVVEKENVVTLSNGCVCCSLRKDIVKAFAIIERQARVKPIDSVILETTGLADPAPVAFTFFANPWIASRFRLDSIMWVWAQRTGKPLEGEGVCVCVHSG